MKKTYLLAMGMVPLSHSLMAQVPVSKDANSMRSGDLLCKVEVDYVNPGQRGNDAVWEMGLITDKSKDFYQGIEAKGDTISIFEDSRIRHYVVHGDTLFDKGEQQRRSYRLYDEERPVVRYPFSLGDSISGAFRASGMDESMELKVSGSGYSVADGVGILTDGEDTIKHVIRIHLYDDYTENYGGQSELRFRKNHYMWYCAGYRYPVMESITQEMILPDAQIEPMDSVTYMYLPISQLELAEDAVNDSIWESMSVAEALQKVQGGFLDNISSIDASLSSDGRNLNIRYSMTGSGRLAFSACDILGNMLGYAHYDIKEAGDWQECIKLNRKPIGNTLMLNIRCGEEVKSMKVYQ